MQFPTFIHFANKLAQIRVNSDWWCILVVFLVCSSATLATAVWVWARQSPADIHAANTPQLRSLALQCDTGGTQKVVWVTICMWRPGQWCSELTQPAYTSQHQWRDSTHFESRLSSPCVSPQPLLRTGDMVQTIQFISPQLGSASASPHPHICYSPGCRRQSSNSWSTSSSSRNISTSMFMSSFRTLPYTSSAYLHQYLFDAIKEDLYIWHEFQFS